jgi:hypothetical protein
MRAVFAALVGALVVAVAATVVAEEPPAPPGGAAPTSSPSPAGPFTVRHFGHIRLAALCYSKFTFTPFADDMLRSKLDFVIPDGKFLSRIQKVSPDTPTAIYANLSNIYLGGLLEDWLEYADANGHDREDLFFHAASAGPWSGAGGSTQPVTWFHAVLQGRTKHDDRTYDAHSASESWMLPSTVGLHCAVGYFEPFREIHVALAGAAGNGWQYEIEYPNAVGPKKEPTGWAPLSLASDGTSGFTTNGILAFDPPRGWKPCRLGASALNYFVRIRCAHVGRPPRITTLLGRDWAGANGGSRGTVPAFDPAADGDGDGYLTDSEYARRTAGKDARFRYESRIFTTYGQMRFGLRPGLPSVAAWASDQCKRYLAAFPLAKGLFIDNSSGTTGLCDAPPAENVASFAQEYAALLASVARSVSPKFLIANTTGSLGPASPIVEAGIHYYDEFALRPMQQTWQGFGTMAEIVNLRRAAAAKAAVTPSGVLDSLSEGAAPTDPRAHLGVLSLFYVLADPEHQLLEFWGGQDPSGPWEAKWCGAVAFDVGKPKGEHSEWASGPDPQNAKYVYKVYRREYDNAVVLFKPRSFFDWSNPNGTLDDATATKHDLGGAFRPVAADGTLGDAVTSVSLRNGEGAILARAGADR